MGHQARGELRLRVGRRFRQRRRSRSAPGQLCSNVVLYRNNTDDKNWLRIKAVGTKSNPEGIGARVRVSAKDQLVGFRQIQAGAGYGRCSPIEAPIGLGNAAVSYRVEVVFNGSNTRVVRDNVKAGQRIVVREDEAK